MHFNLRVCSTKVLIGDIFFFPSLTERQDKHVLLQRASRLHCKGSTLKRIGN